MKRNSDVLIVGGGVIGLSIALELRRRGVSVTVVERGSFGMESSWAGAGIIYPAQLSPSAFESASAFDRLRAVSYAAWPDWSTSFGMDVGFRQTGGITLARDPGELTTVRDELCAESAICTSDALARMEPHLRAEGLQALSIPGVSQVRNPWLIRGLESECTREGVNLLGNTEIVSLTGTPGQKVIGVRLQDETYIHADATVVCAGAWSASVMKTIGVSIPVEPIRGQMILYHQPGLVNHIIEVGKRYVVPRTDGRLLVGSTEEAVGFEKQTTDEGLRILSTFAGELFHDLRNAVPVASWAGLRPGSPGGIPFLGPVSEFEGLWIAAGHYRLGLQLSVGTAKLVADWLTNRESFATTDEFGPTMDRNGQRKSFSA